MASVKVKLRPSTVAGRPGCIVYQITHRRVVKLFTTSYKLYPEEWDAKSQSIVFVSNNMREKELRDISQEIGWDMERINKVIAKYNSRYYEYTSDDIVKAFQRLTKENGFFYYMETIIKRLRTLNRIGTANNYRAALNSFKRFRNDEDLLIEAMGHDQMEDYQYYLKQSGLVPNSISFYMRIIRAVYNRAVKQELTQDRNLFHSVFTGMERTRKRAISLDKVKKIKGLDLSLKPNLEFARDVFLFLFYCRGMSFIDAAFLKKSDMRNGMISYRRHKTNQLLHVKIIEPIHRFLERYSVNDSPYLLPIIVHPGENERRQYESALRRVNNALKTISELADLPISLTTYVSRHAWASIAQSKNISVNIISDALGHDSISTTQIYLTSIDTSEIDKANELVIKGL